MKFLQKEAVPVLKVFIGIREVNALNKFAHKTVSSTRKRKSAFAMMDLF